MPYFCFIPHLRKFLIRVTSSLYLRVLLQIECLEQLEDRSGVRVLIVELSRKALVILIFSRDASGRIELG